MSGKVRRYISLFVLGSFLFLVTLFILARLVITPERIRTTFVPVVERLLQCDVNLEAIDVTLFSGATLANIELLRHEDGALILAADKVVLRYQLLPLFFQRIVVDEIKLLHPRLNLERLSDGHFNYQDFFVAKKELSHRSSSVDGKQVSDIDILISHLYIQDGELLFKDYTFGHAPHRYKLTHFDLHLVDFSLHNDFKFELWGKLNGAPVDIEGSVNLFEDRYNVKLIVDQLDLVQFQPYYRDEINGRIDALKVGINARFNGGTNALSSDGIVTLYQLDYASSTVSDFLLRGDVVEAKYDIAIDSQRTVLIDALQINYDSIYAKLAGRVSLATSTPDVDLHIVVPGWSLRKGHDLLPRSLESKFSSYDLAGDVDVDLVLRGRGSLGLELIQKSTIKFDAVQASVNDLRPSLSGTIITQGGSLHSSDLSLVVGDNTLHLDLASDTLWQSRPMIKSTLEADVLDFEKMSNGLRGGLSNSSDFSSRGTIALREITEPGPASLPFDVVGTFSVANVKLQRLDLTSVQGNYSLRNNVLEYDSLSAAVFGGRLDTSGSIDLTRQGFAYSGHVNARNIQLSQLSQAFDLGDDSTISGVTATTFDYRGAGTQTLRVQQNLSGSGVFDIVNGSMSGTALMDEVATILELEEFHLFRFSEAHGTFDLMTGSQLQYDAEFKGSRSRLQPVGTWRNGGAIEAELAVYLSPELSRQVDSRAKVLPYLQQSDGWSYVPLLVRGSLGSPSLSVDVVKAGRSVLHQVGDAIVDELQDRAGHDSTELTEQVGVDIIESAIKGVLGN